MNDYLKRVPDGDEEDPPVVDPPDTDPPGGTPPEG